MSRKVPYIEEYTGVPEPPQCNICKHFEGYGLCPAFPEGIPIEIVTNQLRHTDVLEDEQVGVWVWEPVA